MSKSLKQIATEIQDFARGHGQLYTAKFNRQEELLEGGSILYPALYFTYVDARKEKNVLVINFQAWIADRLNSDRNNEDDVYNDATLIACDLLGFLDSTDRDYALTAVGSIKPFTEQRGDNTAGVMVPFSLSVPFPYDRCIVPTKPQGFVVIGDDDVLTTGDDNITVSS